MSNVILGKVKEDVNAFGEGFALKVNVSDSTTRFQLNTKSTKLIEYTTDESVRAIPLYNGLNLKYILFIKHETKNILKNGFKVSKKGIFSNKDLTTDLAPFIGEEGIVNMELVEESIKVHTDDGIVNHSKAELEDRLQKQLDIPFTIEVFELTK